jgi:hypothetical protein
MFEMAFVGTIAKRLVLGEAAAADADDLSSCEAIWCSIAIDDLEISFQFERSVAIDDDLCCGHDCVICGQIKGKLVLIERLTEFVEIISGLSRVVIVLVALTPTRYGIR